MGKSDSENQALQAGSDKPLVTHRRTLPKAVWYWMTSMTFLITGKLFFRLRVENAKNMPSEGPVVLLSNHQSHLDPPLVGGTSPRQLSTLARDTLFKGLLGVLIRSYDTVPVDRTGTGLSGLRAILKRLKQGGAVLLFPEGTRSHDGMLQPLKGGFIPLVRRNKVAIIPVGIDGSYEAWPKGQKLPSFFTRICMHYGERISPETIAELDDEQLLAHVTEKLALAVSKAGVMNGKQATDS